MTKRNTITNNKPSKDHPNRVIGIIAHTCIPLGFFLRNFKAEASPTSKPGFRHSTLTRDEEEEESEESEDEVEEEDEERREALTKPLRVRADRREEEESRGEGVVSCERKGEGMMI